MTGVRITYGKGGALRFLGHLDTSRLWQRTLRRAGLPLAFTEGYQPRPKIATGPPLSLGFTSRAEFLDVNLTAHVMPDAVRAALTPVLAPGLTLERVEPLTSNTPKLASLATFSYIASLPQDAPPLDRATLEARVHDVLSREHLRITRHRKNRERTVDLRPSLVALHVEAPSNGVPGTPVLTMTFATTRDGTANPREILGCLQLWTPATIRESHIERYGATFAGDDTKGLHETATHQQPITQTILGN